MALILLKMFQELLQAASSIMDMLLSDLIPNALHAENAMTTLTGRPILEPLYNILFSFGISLIVLNFLYKGFNIYIGWTDGDPDADPIGLLTNMVRALAVAVGFPIIYSWAAGIVESITDQLLQAMGMHMYMDYSQSFMSMVIAANGTTNGIALIIYMIFFIMFFMVGIQMMGRGVELLILRLGIPIAAVGLLNSDKGIFGSMTKIIIRNFITVVIQIVLIKLSFVLMINVHPIWAVAVIMVTTKAPKMLSEFIIPYGGGGNIMGAAYQVSGLISRAAQIVKKK